MSRISRRKAFLSTAGVAAAPSLMAAPGALVLLDQLSGLLVLVGTEAFRG